MKFLFLVLLVSVCYVPALNQDVFHDSDEEYYIIGSRNILESGNFLTPSYYGQPRFQKPPLMYWLGSFFLKASHVLKNKIAAVRLISLISAFIILFLVLQLSTTLQIKNLLLPLLILAGTPFFIQHSLLAKPEMLQTMFITLSLLSFLKAELEQSQKYLFVFIISLALGVLTKGYFSIVLCLITIIIFSIITKNASTLKKIFHYKYLFVFILLVTPWFIYMISTFKNEYFNHILHREVSTRIGFSYKNILYYSTGILTGSPFSFFFILSLRFYIQYLKKPLFLISENKHQSKTLILLLSWVITTAVILSMSAEYVIHYWLCVTIPCALLTAFFIEQHLKKSLIRKTYVFLAVILSLILTSIIILSFYLGFQYPILREYNIDLTPLAFFSLFFLIVYLIANILGFKKQWNNIKYSYLNGIFILVYLCGLISFILPKTNLFLAQNIAQSLNEKNEIIFYEPQAVSIFKRVDRFFTKEIKSIKNETQLEKILNVSSATIITTEDFLIASHIKWDEKYSIKQKFIILKNEAKGLTTPTHYFYKIIILEPLPLSPHSTQQPSS